MTETRTRKTPEERRDEQFAPQVAHVIGKIRGLKKYANPKTVKLETANIDTLEKTLLSEVAETVKAFRGAIKTGKAAIGEDIKFGF